MTQQHETDEYTDGIEMGVVWEEEPVSPGTPLPREEGTPGGTEQETDPGTQGDARRSEGETGGTPTAGAIVPADAPDAAVSPKRALLDDVNERLKASLSAWHTYALLAWSRRWATAEAYVQDPHLYEEIVEEARAEIRRKRTAVAKKLTKAKIRKDAESVRVLQEELEELERKAPSAMAMDALTLKARGGRLAKQAALPAAVVLGPVAAGAMVGAWWALLAWPAAWVWLAVQGHAIAVAEGSVSVREVSLPVPSVELGGSAPVVPVASPGGVPGTTVVGATEAENRLLARLAAWSEVTSGRGLEGVVPGSPTVDALGIRVVLTASGKHTPESLEKKMPAIRAALSVPRDVRSDLSEGDYGDQAVLRIRTRTPSRDMVWRPGRVGIGVDTETGNPVVLPKGRMLIAGTSGAGKSVLVRVAMAEALQSDEPTTVVYIDAKGEEAGLWRDKIRCATEEDDILKLLGELNRESYDRSQIMQEQGVSTWTPTQDRPRIVVVIDEGAEVIAMHDTSAKDPAEHVDVLGPIGPLGRLGRSRAIDVKWATQKPTLGQGIPSQLNGVMQDRIVLKTAGRNENNQVLGSDWKTHELELGGYAVTNVAGRGPDQAPILVWDLSSDAAVAGVPGGGVWSYRPRSQAREEEAVEAPQEPGLPAVLSAALLLSEGANGVKGEAVAKACEMDLLDAQNALRDAGVKAGRFTNSEGSQVRGYRREDLEEAASRYSV